MIKNIGIFIGVILLSGGLICLVLFWEAFENWPAEIQTEENRQSRLKAIASAVTAFQLLLTGGFVTYGSLKQRRKMIWFGAVLFIVIWVILGLSIFGGILDPLLYPVEERSFIQELKQE